MFLNKTFNTRNNEIPNIQCPYLDTALNTVSPVNAVRSGDIYRPNTSTPLSDMADKTIIICTKDFLLSFHVKISAKKKPII